jgi:hypothetical protein
MRRIKKFESFNYPMPKEISEKEWDKKIQIHGYEPFDKMEMEFYKKLRRENHRPGRKTGRIYEINLEESDIPVLMSSVTNRSPYDTISISSESAFSDFETNISADIEIIKLGDEWYLIHEYTLVDPFEDDDDQTEDVKLFLCDQWEEVLGYLQMKTSLIL